MIGRINSFQSLGTVDGPGLRYVVFMQGCPLRCSCCHNPETWEISGGEVHSVDEVFSNIVKYKEYFAEKGGLTVSGGEPLLQAEFVRDLFKKCKENSINTCLDTSGVPCKNATEILEFTDIVLLDIKYTDEEKYKKHVGCSFSEVLKFLKILEKKKIRTIVRQVAVPDYNMDRENYIYLKELKRKYSCIEKIELLPFKKLCVPKYKSMKTDFAFENVKEPTALQMEEAQRLIED